MENLIATPLARTILFTILWVMLWMAVWLFAWEDNVNRGGWFVGVYSLPIPSLVYYLLDKILSKQPVFSKYPLVIETIIAAVFVAIFPVWLAVGFFMLRYPYGYLEYYILGNPF